MDSSVKKDTYELLSMSSSDSDTPQQIQEINLKSRRKKLRKRLPAGRSRYYENYRRQKCYHSNGKIMSLSFIIIILCCWLLILSWLVVVFNDELKRYDVKLMAIVTGNQGTSESLQKCHAETKVLQKNQSELFAQFAKLSTKMTNLTTEVSSLRAELQRIQDRLKSLFDSSDGSSNSGELPFNMSSIHDVFEKLNNTVAQLKASGDSLKTELSEMRRNFTSLTANPSFIVPNKISVDNTSSTEASNALGNFSLLVSTLYSNMTYLNESLTSQIQSMKKGLSLDSSAEEQLNNLLNQNISIRLDGVERKCSALSNAIYNIPLIPKTYNRMNNSSNVTIT